MHLHGLKPTSQSTIYWPLPCHGARAIGVLDTDWTEEDALVPATLGYLLFMENREWTFKPYWVEPEYFDATFEYFTDNPQFFREIRLLSHLCAANAESQGCQ